MARTSGQCEGDRRLRATRASRPGDDGKLFSFLAGAVLASLANLLANGPAPSRLVRVGPLLGGHPRARNPGLCRGRPGLLLEEIGRRLLAIFAASAAKKTHGAMVDRRLADRSPLSCAGWLAQVSAAFDADEGNREGSAPRARCRGPAVRMRGHGGAGAPGARASPNTPIV